MICFILQYVKMHVLGITLFKQYLENNKLLLYELCILFRKLLFQWLNDIYDIRSINSHVTTIAITLHLVKVMHFKYYNK